MSHVTTLTLTHHDWKKAEEALKKMNKFLEETSLNTGSPFQYLDSISIGSAGTKFPEDFLIRGGMNYFNVGEFISFFIDLKLSQAVLILNTEGDQVIVYTDEDGNSTRVDHR